MHFPSCSVFLQPPYKGIILYFTGRPCSFPFLYRGVNSSSAVNSSASLSREERTFNSCTRYYLLFLQQVLPFTPAPGITFYSYTKYHILLLNQVLSFIPAPGITFYSYTRYYLLLLHQVLPSIPAPGITFYSGR